jgi:NitT/TauT family transport system substrate-binding protein
MSWIQANNPVYNDSAGSRRTTRSRPRASGTTLGVLVGALLVLTLLSPASWAQRVVRVGSLPATHDALLFIAKEENLFDRSRIDVQVATYDNSVQILNDLKNGLLDIGIPGIATPAAEIGGRAPLSIVGGAASKSAALVVPKSELETFARAEDPLAKLRLLRGKKVGATRGSTGLAIFRQGLLRAGLDEKALEIREFSKPSEIVSSLVTGGLEAGLLWSPHMTLAEDRDLGIALWMSDILKDHVCCRQIARDEFLQDADATVEYLVGTLKADMLFRRSQSDPKLRSKLMADVRHYLTTLTEKQLERELFGEDPRTTISPDLDRQGIEDYLKAMETAGLMRGDQCANVREKIRPDFMQAAYRRLGCKAPIDRNCVDKRAAECECTSLP